MSSDVFSDKDSDQMKPNKPQNPLVPQNLNKPDVFENGTDELPLTVSIFINEKGLFMDFNYKNALYVKKTPKLSPSTAQRAMKNEDAGRRGNY